MINRKNRLFFLLSLALILTAMATSAYALTYPDSFYDSIAWTWWYNPTYDGPATSSYNCLGYATGSMYWEWPWGGRNPSDYEVTTYLSNKGYSKDNIFPTIISYGTASSITHFSKVVDSTVTRAKWGHLERLTSGSWDPYYTSSYGHPVSKYRK